MYFAGLVNGMTYQYTLYLCKPNREIITSILFSDISFSNNFNDYNSLSFSIQKQITQTTGEVIQNPSWDLLIDGLLVLLTITEGADNATGKVFSEYYYVSTPSSADEYIRQFECIPQHQNTFNKTKVRGYNDTRKLFDFQLQGNNIIPTTYDADDYTIGGIMNYILEYKLPNWTITHYDNLLDNLHDDIQNVDSAEISALCASLYNIWGDDNLIDSWYTPLVSYLNDLKMPFYSLTTFIGSATEDIGCASLAHYHLNNVYDKFNNATTVAGFIEDTQKLIQRMSYCETALSYLQTTVDKLITIDAQEVSQDNSSYNPITETLNFYNYVVENLYTPLLAYKGIAGSKVYRTLSLQDNLTSIFEQLSESYQCFFEFDNVQQTIQIFAKNNPRYNQIIDLLLTPDNFITSFNYTPDFEKVCTRLYLKGKNDLSVAGANPTGQAYVDNFSYYKNRKYMSGALLVALNRYENKLQTYENEGIIIGNKTYTLQDIFVRLEEYNARLAELLSYKTKWDYANYDRIHTAQLYSESSGIDAETYEKQLGVLDSAKVDYEYYLGSPTSSTDGWSNIDRLRDLIAEYENARQTIADDLIYYDENDLAHSNFTQELYNELVNFIFEDDIDVASIDDDRVAYSYAKQYLSYINTVPISVEVDLIDVFSNAEFQQFWGRFSNIGELIYVSHPDYNLENMPIRLLSYTHNPKENTLSLKFGNQYEMSNSLNKLTKNIWGYAYKIASNTETYLKDLREFVDNKNKILQEGKEIRAEVNSIVDSSGTTIVDGRGVLLSSQPSNGLVKNKDGLFVYGRHAIHTPTDQFVPSRATLQFQGNVAVADDAANDKTIISINGGSEGSNIDSFPLYVPSNYFSNKLVKFLAGDSDTIPNNLTILTMLIEGVTQSVPVIFYQEFMNDEHRWVCDVLAVDENDLCVKTDYTVNGLPIYWATTKSTSGTLIKSNKLMTYTAPSASDLPDGTTVDDYKVKVWQTTGQSFISFVTELDNSTFLPKCTYGFGAGDTSDPNSGKGFLEKTTDGLKVFYKTRIGYNDSTKDTEIRFRGIHIKDTGLYQIRGDDEYFIPIMRPISSVDDMTTENGFEENDIGYIISE